MTSNGSSRALQKAPRKPATQGKRELVLDAAVELFLAEGFDRTSKWMPSRPRGVSKTTVYAHFGDKVELFHAVTAPRARPWTSTSTR